MGAALLFCLVSLLPSLPAHTQLTQEDIETLRREAIDKGWTFTVGENEATRRPVEHLAGVVITEEVLAEAAEKTLHPKAPDKSLPSWFDWREQVSGPLPTIKDQGGCGSCWAFATVGALEWAIKIVDGDAVDLSEQWLLGCNTSLFGNDCDGGFILHNYHKNQADQCGQSGAVLEADCPYQERDDYCECPYTHHYWIQDWAYVGNVLTPPPVEDIKAALYSYGPLACYVKMSKSFIAYTGGVFNDHDGEKIELTDHAVVIIGWDDNQGAAGAWIVKNSWGTSWGDDGYGYMQYGVNLIGAGASYIIYGDALAASPRTISASGEMGGPFSATGDEVLLKNTGTSALTWSATSPAWLPLSAYGGTLEAGSQLYLGISLGASAYTLEPGEYTGNINLVNETSGGSFTVTVTLTVTAPLIYEFPLDVNPGWSLEGQWAFGAPLGGGSENRDPNAAYTGNTVYGYNLAGNYANALPATALTTTALDFTTATDVQLRFMRWLGVEEGQYDKAVVRVSNNGSTWTTVWTNPANTDVADTAWTECVYDISDLADGQPQVYVQWVMGPTDSSVAYPGWNIDDIQFRGIRPVEGEGEGEPEGEPEGECEELAPYFTVSSSEGGAPLPVSFTNLTTGYDGIMWEFGDGGYSMDWSPTHVYQAPGTFVVILYAWNLCEEKTWQETIHVVAPEGEDEGEGEGEGGGEGEGEDEGEGEGEGEGEAPAEGEGEGEPPVPHPADTNEDFRLVLSEAIAYLAGWQQGANPIAYAIRAAYLWQGGETYAFTPEAVPPLCWVLAPPLIIDK